MIADAHQVARRERWIAAPRRVGDHQSARPEDSQDAGRKGDRRGVVPFVPVQPALQREHRHL